MGLSIESLCFEQFRFCCQNVVFVAHVQGAAVDNEAEPGGGRYLSIGGLGAAEGPFSLGKVSHSLMDTALEGTVGAEPPLGQVLNTCGFPAQPEG